MALKFSEIKKKDDFVTIIGSEWADPIADLAYAWGERVKKDNYPKHFTPRDKGTCYAIILLLVVMLESYTQRAATESKNGTVTKYDKPFEAPAWWLTSSYDSKDYVCDVFGIRNSLAHNHLYSYSVDDVSQMDSEYTHLNGGNSEFRTRTQDGKYKASGISSIVNKIGPTDLISVAKIVRDSLNFLFEHFPAVGNVDFNFARRAQHSNLWDLINESANAANSLIG